MLRVLPDGPAFSDTAPLSARDSWNAVAARIEAREADASLLKSTPKKQTEPGQQGIFGQKLTSKAKVQVAAAAALVPQVEVMSGGEYFRRFGRSPWAPPEVLVAEEAWRHRFWATHRHCMLSAMEACSLPAARIDRFVNCGSGAHVQWSEIEQRHRVSAHYCHDRFCRPCQGARAKTIRSAIAARAKGKDIRFLTLTLAHSRIPLGLQIDRIYAAFVKLRGLPIWKSGVLGGVVFLELAIGKHDDLWHVHLHCLIEGTYMQNEQLSQAWKAVTGDSYIVDIQRPKSIDGLCRYVTAYVTKGIADAVIEDPEKLQEAMKALKGRRMCGTFGTWRGLDLTASVPEATDWKEVGSLDKVLRSASRGEPWARAILKSLRPGDSDPPSPLFTAELSDIDIRYSDLPPPDFVL